MNCLDFQRKWNELLDREARVVDTRRVVDATAPGPDRDPTDDEDEALLLAHAANCPACRPIALGYQTLRHAVRAWRQPPVPPPDLIRRVLSAPADTSPPIWDIAAARARRLGQDRGSRIRLIVLAGAAASAMIALLVREALDGRSRRDRPGRPAPLRQAFDEDFHPIAAPHKAPGSPIALHRALAEATSVTLDLARSASEPAARISHDMLGVTEQRGEGATRPLESAAPASARPSEGLVGLSVPLPSLDPLASETMGASRVFQQVGDQLSAGAAPLSSTARHAFGFLLGSPRDRAGSRAARSTPTGA